MSDNDSAQAVAEEEQIRQQASYPKGQPTVVEPQYPQQPSRPSQTFAGVPRGFRPPDPNRDRPLLSEAEDRLYLDVERVEVAEGSPEGADDGWCGTVNDDEFFKKAILKKWGGGVYVVTGRYNGKDVEKRVKLPGKSKPIVVEEDEEGEGDESYYTQPSSRRYAGDDYSPRPGYGRRAYGAYGASPYADPYSDPYGHQGGYDHQGGYGPPSSPYGASPYGPPSSPYGSQGGYGSQGYSRPGWQGPPLGAGAGGQGLYNQIDDPEQKRREEEEKRRQEELALLREQLEIQREEIQAAREEAAKEREDRRVELERAEAKRRESELKAQLERQEVATRAQLESLRAMIQQQGSSKGDDMFTKMMEMQLLAAQNAQAQREAERADRDARWREEQVRREAEQKRREQEIKAEQKERTAERQLELERMEKERDRDRKFMEQQIHMVKSGQQTPDQMLTMLRTVMDMNPRKDATTQMIDFAQAAMAIKEFMGGGQEENQVQGIIRTAGEAAATALREIRGGTAPAQVAEDTAMLQAAAQQHQLTYDPQAAALQAQQQALAEHEAELMAQQAQAQSVNPPPSATRDPTEEEWGRIVRFVVESYIGGNSPSDTVPHLNTFLAGLGVPAVMLRLEGATVTMLRWQISQVNQAIPATSEYRQHVDTFVTMLSEEQGSAWVTKLLDSIRSYLAQIRQQRKRYKEAMEQEAADREREEARSRAVEEAQAAQSPSSVQVEVQPPVPPAAQGAVEAQVIEPQSDDGSDNESF